MIGRIIAFKPTAKGGGGQLAYLAGDTNATGFTDYHHKDALGIWACGSGLADMGLSDGSFNREATRRLAEGFHGTEDRHLAKNAGRDHRQGWDITMDDPKDFSLVHAFGTDAQKADYYEARQAAWRLVVSEIERLARPKYAGHEGPVKIAMQIFEHDDSRSGDPHKHGHGFLFNVGVLPDGKTCAIDVGPIMRNKAYLGQIYQSELARQYAMKGRAVAFDVRESTDTRTKTRYAVATIPGLATPEQLAGFSERAADIAAALDAKGANHSVKAKNAAALSTRDEKKLTHQEMRAMWDQKAKDLGLDMASFHAAIDAKAFAPDDKAAILGRVFEEVTALFDQAIDGNGIIQDHDIAFAAARAMRGQPIDDVRKSIQWIQSKLVFVQGDNGFGAQYTTHACLALERGLVANLKIIAGRQPETPILVATCAKAEEAWEAKTGHRLTNEQRAAARHIVSGPGMLANIEGEAGTGKSTLMEVGADAWKASGLKVMGAAPTGKAAEALAASLGEACTCARLLMDLEAGRMALDAQTVLVIDECGMLASPTYAKLVRHAVNAGAKLVCVGDRKQLAAIGMRGGFEKAIEAAGMASITENRRQMNAKALGSSIGKMFREGKAGEALDMIEQEGRLTTLSNEGAIVPELARRWIADEASPMNKMVLAELVETVGELNEAIRNARKEAGQLGEGVEIELTTKDGGKFRQELAVGDKIMFLQNAGKKAGVMNVDTHRPASPKNGTAAIIEDIRIERDGSALITARTDDGKLLRWSAADYSTFALGYAHSYHKSQGSTAVNVYAIAEGSQVAALGLAYVGATRHKNDCHIFVSEDARQRWVQRASTAADSRMISERVADAEAQAAAKAQAQVQAPTQTPAPTAKTQAPPVGAALPEAGAEASPQVASTTPKTPTPEPPKAQRSKAKGIAIEMTGGHRLFANLIDAIKRGHLDAAASAIEAGAEIDACVNGFIPMLTAAQHGRVEMLQLLMDNGADIEIRTSRFKQTPLLVAALKGQSMAAMLLAQSGADILAQDSTGRTASQLAREVGYKDLANDLWLLEKEQRSARTVAANALPTPKPNPAPQPSLESTPETKPTPAHYKHPGLLPTQFIIPKFPKPRDRERDQGRTR